MSYYLDLIQEIKDNVKKNNYPPVFKNSFLSFSKRNCYAYSLNLNVHDPKKKFLYPGCISSEYEDPHIYSWEKLLERFKRDLEFLGFTFRLNDQNLEENEYRIAVYSFPTFYEMPIEFHFSRQDGDGYWSEKPNWNSMPRKLNYCGIEPPELINAKPSHKEVFIIKKV